MGLGGMDFGTTDPKKITQQNRQWDLSTGQGLMDQSGAWAIGRGQNADQTSAQLQGVFDPTGRKSSLDSYLNPAATTGRLDSWMTPLANGQGGYSADELSQIRMSPEQQEDMVRQSGISAGLANSAAAGAASRAAAGAGGANPMALAAYRARAAQSSGQQAGDAMTNARVAASNAAAGRAQSIGNTRLGQQQQGLNYYQGLQGQGTNYLTGQLTGGENYLGNLQQQQTGQQESALNRQAQIYNTASDAANNSANTAQKASQNPTTFDKIMGGVSGAVSAFLEDGDVMPGKKPAVIGENGPERVVSTKGEYMGAGGVIPSLFSKVPTSQPDLGTTTPNADGSLMFSPGADNPGSPPSLYDNVPSASPSPARDLGATTTNADGSLTFAPGADSQPLAAQKPGGFSGFMNRLKSNMQGPQQQQRQQPPSSMNTAETIGRGAGSLLKAAFLEDGDVTPDDDDDPAPQQQRRPAFLEDGDVTPQGANGIFTRPTAVNLQPGEAVVPLTYRAGAKVRPSVATKYPAAPAIYRSQRGANGQSSARP